MNFGSHISSDDLERYYLGMVTLESELAPLEEHLLACSSCVDRSQAILFWIDRLRAALAPIRGVDRPSPRLRPQFASNESNDTGHEDQ